MKFTNLRIKRKLFILCVILVSLPTIILGILAYFTFQTQIYNETKQELSRIVRDWSITTQSYVQQYKRVIKREEVLLSQRLQSNTQNTLELIKLNSQLGGKKEDVLEELAEMKIGRSGYVFILDNNGQYILSKERGRDGEIVIQHQDTNGTYVIQDLLRETKKLPKDEVLISSYDWSEKGDTKFRKMLVASAYYAPWEATVATGLYYTDFRSDELLLSLQTELRDKIGKQKIGAQGYIWVTNSKGDYIVSKDRLRDGENIIDEVDEKGVKFVPKVIEKAITLKPEESFLHTYSWKNLGEKSLQQKLSAVGYIQEWDWIIGASINNHDFLQGLDKISFYIMTVVLISITLGSAISYFLSLQITIPISKLEKIANRAATGDLTIAISPQLTNSTDEIGSLAKSIKTMITNISSQFTQIQNEISQRKQIEDKLRASNEEFQRINNLMVGRELKMVELKKEIENLKSQTDFKDKHSV